MIKKPAWASFPPCLTLTERPVIGLSATVILYLGKESPASAGVATNFLIVTGICEPSSGL